jgi:hypothetical protein
VNAAAADQHLHLCHHQRVAKVEVVVVVVVGAPGPQLHLLLPAAPALSLQPQLSLLHLQQQRFLPECAFSWQGPCQVVVVAGVAGVVLAAVAAAAAFALVAAVADGGPALAASWVQAGVLLLLPLLVLPFPEALLPVAVLCQSHLVLLLLLLVLLCRCSAVACSPFGYSH